MPKTKKTTVTEEVEDTPIPEPKYTEDIQNKSMAEVAQVPDATEVSEPTKEEAKPEEPVKEEVKEPEFDQEKFKQETAAAVKAEIADFLKGDNKEQTKERGSEYAEFAKKIEDAEGRPPTYLEALDFVKDQAKAEIKAEQEQAYKAYQEQQATNQEGEKRFLEDFNKRIDEQLDELYRSNKLPKIKNQDDPTDYGSVARQQLFQTMAEVNTKRRSEGLAPIQDLHRIYNVYYKAPARQPAGADAPIAGGDGNMSTPSDDEELNYFRDVKGGFKRMVAQVLKK